MSYLSGQHGQLWHKAAAENGDPSQIGALRSWSLSSQMNVLDTTTMDKTDRTLIHGVRSFSGSATLLYYPQNNVVSNLNRLINNSFKESNQGRNQFASRDFGRNDEPVATYIILRLFDGNPYDLELDVFITSFSVSVAVGEVVSADIGFEGIGAPLSLLP